MREHHQAPEPDNQNPVVTVVIPCHNHADMVFDAIESVLQQDYRPLKIIVVDDGSTDGLEEKIRKPIYKNKEFIEIFYIRNETAQGPSAARNRAIEEMWDKTDLFMMLDADDLYLEGKISKSVQKYKENTLHTGIVYTDAIIKNINTGTSVHEFRQAFSREALERECIISNTPLITKEALSSSGGYDEEMRTCEDWDLWLRITESFVAIHIPEPLHVYHVTGNNSCDVVSQEIWNENWKKISYRIAQRKNAQYSV